MKRGHKVRFTVKLDNPRFPPYVSWFESMEEDNLRPILESADTEMALREQVEQLRQENEFLRKKHEVQDNQCRTLPG